MIALYIRLSANDKKVGSNSIEHQKLLLTKYAENLEMQNIKLLEFVDNGYSGTNFERPAIQELLELVKTYQVNCIMVKDFSRFGRNMIQTGYVRPDRAKVEVEERRKYKGTTLYR